MERKWQAALELQLWHPSSLKKKKASISGICNVGPTSKSFKPTPLAPIIYRTQSRNSDSIIPGLHYCHVLHFPTATGFLSSLL
ncbi:hypothetical protein D5086_011696 [Populus alba]|uniref:Uncharacterized protein n=1 Tax=Populus alba TaxID=43335 RepID=A0ACC4CE85_POPAL